MTGSMLGKQFRITSFGESHGDCVGIVVEGCPAGVSICQDDIQRELDKRKPGQSEVTTSRSERDRLEILSGIFNEHTTGAPICMLTWNTDVDSSEYHRIRYTPRPGHADYTAYKKYNGLNDYRGGGRFSGRITAGFVMAGSIAKMVLNAVNIEVVAHTVEIAGIETEKTSVKEIKKTRENNIVRCADQSTAETMIEAIKDAEKEDDSVGGKIEVIVNQVPPGLGEPVFDTVEGQLAKAMFAVPAIKGVEFGSGFTSARMNGSEHNDAFSISNDKIITKTNYAGGVNGGITNGMPIRFTVAVKPTPSISKPQNTVNMKKREKHKMRLSGRHDPCIVPRAVPVVEAMTAVVICDLELREDVIPQVINDEEEF